MKLKDFLDKKPLYYKKIDYKRMPKAWNSINEHFKLPKIIHIVGTNGKGSTGRFLAHFLYKCNIKVGHYSSPHILKFNERIWIDGEDIKDEILEKNHQKLLSILSTDFALSLSYFEYTTLLGILCFQKCEYLILEAGLGGEYDATTVFGSDLTLITPISLDHEEFLGDNIEKISTTKLKAIRKFAILGKQEDKIVYKVSKTLSRKNSLEIFRYDHFFCFEGIQEAKETIKKLNLADFFVDNLLLGMAGAKFFGFDIKFEKMLDLKLFGRCQKIRENITIDVGHNVAAASALFKHFKNEKIILIYNSYKDKDYEKILKIFLPIIKKIEFLPILNERVEQKEILSSVVKKLNIPFNDFKNINEDEKYLVFGSFSLVEEFLKHHGEQKQK